MRNVLAFVGLFQEQSEFVFSRVSTPSMDQGVAICLITCVGSRGWKDPDQFLLVVVEAVEVIPWCRLEPLGND